MKYLLLILIFLIINPANDVSANESKFQIDKNDKPLIEIFKKSCNSLLRNNEIIEFQGWKRQKKSKNKFLFVNTETSENLSINIIKRGLNNKTYRFTFNNKLGPKLFITTNSNCKVNIARIIRRNKQNQIAALEELSKDLENVKNIEFVNPEIPYIKPLPKGVEIALIDTGVNYLLPQITKRISRVSPTEINGFDFVDNDELPFDIDFISSSFFPRYHGTSVASILIKEAPQAVIVPYKFSRQNTCSFRDIIKKIKETKIKIALLAMGSKNIKDWECFLYEAQKSQNILFIVTAGNNNLNIDLEEIYPASFELENMVVVSSSTLFGNLAKGSNYGVKSVDFLVNGEQLEVIDHRGVRSIASGSSYAAPRIAAMAVRFFSKNPNANIIDFKRILVKRAIRTQDKMVKYGWIPDPLDNYLF